jgi:hypothetical protein
MLQAFRIHDVHRERSHEEWRIARRNLQNRQPCVQANVRRVNRVLSDVCGQGEQGSEHLHHVNILLPDVEPTRTQVDSKNPVK